MFCNFFNCKWDTVAVYTGFSWSESANLERSTEHIILFQKCIRCNRRRFEYDDPTHQGRHFAESGSIPVALARTQWVHAGKIEITQPDKMTYIDPSLAPLRGFENWLEAIKNDPAMNTLVEDSQLVKDALGQLEVAIMISQK